MSLPSSLDLKTEARLKHMVMMIYLLEWWRFIIIILRSLYQSYIKIVLKQVSILMHGKSLTLSQSTRKEASKLLTIADQSHFFLFLVKVFEKILFNSIFEYFQENCLICENQSGFPPSDSCEYQLLLLFMIFMHLLIGTHTKTWEGYFLIYLKPLIEYGMKGSSTKWNVLV